MFNTCLLDLPVEVFHRIFDFLDAQTIFRSIRCACQQLRATVNTYDRFALNFTSVTKLHFELISNFIGPENVTSLTFSIGQCNQSDKIDFLLSIFNIGQFIRLHSLTLLEIDDLELTRLLKNISVLPLVSLSIHLRKVHQYGTFPSSADIDRLNFRKLRLIGSSYITKNLSHLIHCELQHLAIKNCTYAEYQFILERCPVLQTFEMQSCTMCQLDMIGSISPTSTSQSQLTSLIMNACTLSFEELDLLLSHTPSLIYLKIISSRWKFDSLWDGSRWEQLIQTKLPLLNDFHFCFRFVVNYDSNFYSLHSIIRQYQTPFWLQDKNWLVTCDYVIGSSSSQIMLYTEPIHVDNFQIFVRCHTSSVNDVCYFTKCRLNEENQANEVDVCIRYASVIDTERFFFDLLCMIFSNPIGFSASFTRIFLAFWNCTI